MPPEDRHEEEIDDEKEYDRLRSERDNQADGFKSGSEEEVD